MGAVVDKGGESVSGGAQLDVDRAEPHSMDGVRMSMGWEGACDAEQCSQPK